VFIFDCEYDEKATSNPISTILALVAAIPCIAENRKMDNWYE